MHALDLKAKENTSQTASFLTASLLYAKLLLQSNRTCSVTYRILLLVFFFHLSKMKIAKATNIHPLKLYVMAWQYDLPDENNQVSK